MAFLGINYLAVVAAAVVGFAFGAVYYMSLSRPWLAAVGKTAEAVKGGFKPSPRPFITAAVAQLVMAFMLAGLMGHLGEGGVDASSGAIAGFFIWLGFVVTTMAVNHGFQGARLSLTVIDGGHWLGVLLLQGLVIGLIGL